MKLALLITYLAFLASCTPTSTVTGETTSGNINASAPYMWSSSAFPRDLKISTSFSAAESDNITSMAEQWESSLEDKKNFFKDVIAPATTFTSTTEVDRANMDLDALGDDSINGVYKIQHWPLDLPSSALAVTQIFGRRFNVGDSNEYVRIEHADILLNENLYNFRTSTDGSSNTYDLQTVVLHEMGHFLGLSHKSSGANSIMVPSISSSTVARAPSNIDVSDVASKYALTLGTGASSAIIAQKPLFKYSPNNGDTGSKIKMLIELHANGECVHKENGVVIQRHSAK